MALTLSVSVVDAPPRDVVKQLIENVEAGYHSRIRYAKHSTRDLNWRVVEPRQMVDGAGGLLIRALQIEPEKGVRTFRVDAIVEVQRDPLPLSPAQRKNNRLSTGEVVPFRRSESAGHRELVSSLTRHRPAWTEAWFNAYASSCRDVLLDLNVEDWELARLKEVQSDLGLDQQQIASVHSYLLAEEVLAFSADGRIDDADALSLAKMRLCLETMGYCPF